MVLIKSMNYSGLFLDSIISILFSFIFFLTSFFSFKRSSIEISYKLLNKVKLFISGELVSFSHLEIDCLDIFKYFATSL